MPDSFLLSYASFDENNKPFIDVEIDGKIQRLPILGQDLALEFNFDRKYCTGWVDLENKRGVVCPDKATVDLKYENCLACRNRTGFNPAFYNTTTVSAQQEQVNQQPHFVYLVYFSPEVIKVGISQEARGLRRILEQGARAAIKLETFPSALIARQYEEKISRQDHVVENVTQRKKMELLKTPVNPNDAIQQLIDLQKTIERAIGVKFEAAEIIETEPYFFDTPIDVSQAIHMSNQQQLAGKVVAVVGKALVVNYQSNLLAYDIKQFIGYRANKIDGEAEIELPSEQLALF